MAQTESSITSTAIASITDALGGFEKSTWVFTAYLLTYSGMLLLFVSHGRVAATILICH